VASETRSPFKARKEMRACSTGAPSPAATSRRHPSFFPRAGRDRIGVRLTNDTDWEEIRELVTDSYRKLAPKKLTALLD